MIDFSSQISLQNERWTAPVDHHSIKGEFDPSVHGFHGMNAVSLPGFVYSFDRRVIQAASELPEFPFNLDMNSGNTIGIGPSFSVTFLWVSSHVERRLDAIYHRGWGTKQFGYVLSCTGICTTAKSTRVDPFSCDTDFENRYFRRIACL